jgi:2-methylcitrate dehydratase PrpD
VAVGEALGCNGADILAAIVVGYEIAHRIGRFWHASRDVYQACGSWGSVACAAVAANLMRLGPEQAGHALGIAEYHAANLPMMRDVANPGMVKHGIGWAAMTGVTAAGLAARGYTGIPTLLAMPEYQEWACDIGQDYLMVDGVAWKPARYACCGWAHAGVEGARRLVEENQIDLDAIERILVEGCHGTAALFKGLPSTTEEAQFSQSWPLAAMLVDGEIGPAQILEQRLSDPRIRSLASKVTAVESPEMARLCKLFEQGDPGGRFASMVTIILKDGREYRSGVVDGGLRFPQPDWDVARMDEKLRWMAQFVLDEACTDALSDRVWRFDELTGAAEIIELLTNHGARA